MLRFGVISHKVPVRDRANAERPSGPRGLTTRPGWRKPKTLMLYQRTLRNPICAVGVGLHSGEKVSMTLAPAPANSGITFRRVDCRPAVEIAARADNVGSTDLSTTLVRSHCGRRVSVSTVEHLLSALAGVGIDNARIDIDAAEVPIMDGSAGPFVFLIQSAGVVEQSASKQFIRIREAVRVQEGDKIAELLPCDHFKISFTIDFGHPALASTRLAQSFDLSSTSFIKEISRARTFGFIRDIEQLRAKGLARGGSMDNAVVLDDSKVLNENGLRYADEFVRHKTLDAIGDLYLLGKTLIGEFRGHKSGHYLNNRLLRALIGRPDAWEIVSLDALEDDRAPLHYPGTPVVNREPAGSATNRPAGA